MDTERPYMVFALLCGLRGVFVEMPRAAALDCSGQGAKDAAVAYWSPRIPRDPELTPELLRDCLRETGAWGHEDLDDDGLNWERAIWLAACDWREGGSL